MEAALSELEERSLVRSEGSKRAIFKLTAAGYGLVDAIDPPTE